MGTLMVTYNGHIVGVCTARRAHLTDDVDVELDGEPVGPFFLAMCVYAMEILRDPRLPRYTERRARRFARAMLIPAELLEHLGDFDTLAVARWLGMPARELEAAAHDRRRCPHTAHAPAPRRRPGGRRLA